MVGKKLKVILIISMIFNLLLLMGALDLFKVITKEKNARNNEKLNLYREMISNHFSVQYQLETAIKTDSIDEAADAIALAQNLIFLNIKIDNMVESSATLDMFHVSLNAYLFQYQKVIRRGEHYQHVEDLRRLVQMFEDYKAAINYSYFDDVDTMKRKLFTAMEEVELPFMQ